MERGPNVPADKNDSNGNPVGNSILDNQARDSASGADSDPFRDPSKAETPSKAKSPELNVEGDENGGYSQSNEQNQDSGNDENGADDSSGATTLNDNQAPIEPSFIAAPDHAQTDGAIGADKEQVVEDDGRRELTEDACAAELGYAFSWRKKWWILFVIFLVQTSMNFNTSLYSNGIISIAQEFQVTGDVARIGAALFLITYAFGCELWAPWSEEFGRKLILQLSLSLTNIWAIPVGLAPNITTVLVSRALGGLSTAGGSVTLGMIADMFDSDSQQYAVAFVVFSSVIGSILGPIIGGFIELLPPDQVWRWCTWIQLIFGLVVQLLHLATVPETRTTVLIDRIARKRREAGGDPDIYGPGELHPFKERFTFAELMETWLRALKMLITEPIVLSLSGLSGFSDAIVFMQIQSMNLVYKQWDFNSWQIGLAFVPIAIGYLIAWMIFIPTFWCGQRRREKRPNNEWAQFESRLQPLMPLSILLPLGLGIFAYGSKGPPLHWSISMIGTGLIGIANYSIYMATIDYMVRAYGPYSASATGGNGLARDLLAGIATPAAIPFYTKIAPHTPHSLVYGSAILSVISFLVVVVSWGVYLKGDYLREKSPFCQVLVNGGIISTARSSPPAQSSPDQIPSPPRTLHIPPAHVWEELLNRQVRSPPRQPNFGPAAPNGAYMTSVHAASRRQSRQNSRNPSANPSRRNSPERQEAAVPPGLAGLTNFQEQPRIEEQPSGGESLSDVATIPSEEHWRPTFRHQDSREITHERLSRRRREAGPTKEARSSDEQSIHDEQSIRNEQSTREPYPDEHPVHPDDYPHAVHREHVVEPASNGTPDLVDRSAEAKR
ncbi:major facilitator superfamily domain-containing protein [Xylaria scruposa]|nr:major facilitator superfamily domain-containing protein [Xylaria scruposa]